MIFARKIFSRILEGKCPRPPPSPTPMLATLRESHAIDCRAYWTRCRPPPTITWYRSGSQLSTRQKAVRYRWSVGNHTLYITRLSLSDGGHYQCNASNSEGYRVHSIDFRVYSITAAFYYCCEIAPVIAMSH